MKRVPAWAMALATILAAPAWSAPRAVAAPPASAGPEAYVRWIYGRYVDNATFDPLTPYSPGTAIAHIQVNTTQEYEFWLGGSFTRGFQVKVDGRSIGQAKDEIFDINGYVPMAKLHLTAVTGTDTGATKRVRGTAPTRRQLGQVGQHA